MYLPLIPLIYLLIGHETLEMLSETTKETDQNDSLRNIDDLQGKYTRLNTCNCKSPYQANVFVSDHTDEVETMTHKKRHQTQNKRK